MSVLAQIHDGGGMPWWVWLAIIGGVMMVLGGGSKCGKGSCKPSGLWVVTGLIVLVVVVGLPAVRYLRMQRSSADVAVAQMHQRESKLQDLEAALREVAGRIGDHGDGVEVAVDSEGWVEPPEMLQRDLVPIVSAVPSEVGGDEAGPAPLPVAAPSVGPVEAERAAMPEIAFSYDQPMYAVPGWFQVDEVFLIADTYPSMSAAARGLAAQVAGFAPQVLADGEELKTVTVRTQRLELAGPFIDTLTDRLDNVSTRIVQSDVYEFRANEGNLLAQLMPSGDHQLTLMVMGTAGDRTRTAISVEKRWVDHFDEWTARNPGSWFVAHSPEAANSSIEAMQGAKGYAAVAIAQLLGEQIKASGREVDLDVLGGLVAEAISRGSGVKDVYQQQFSRPNYDVWRALLLIDLDHEFIASIPHAYQGVTSQKQVTIAWRVGSGVVLLGVIVGMYALLNSVTKGYYVGTLRMTGLVLVLAVIAAIVMFLT